MQAGTAGAGAAGAGGIASSDPSYGSVESTSAVKVAVVVSLRSCRTAMVLKGLSALIIAIGFSTSCMLRRSVL